jgi:hypothetical protein
MGAAAKAGLIGGGLLLVLSSCAVALATAGSSDPGAPTSSSGDSATTRAWPTCQDLVSDVLSLSEEKSGDGLLPTVLQVYSPRTVRDCTGAFDSGRLPIEKPKTEVTVLRCTGTASWDDSTKGPIDFSLSVDVNDDVYVSYEPRG